MAYINTKDLKDEEYINSHFIMMCTKKGVVKKTSLEAYSRPRTNGINAITIREGDHAFWVIQTFGNDIATCHSSLRKSKKYSTV